MSSYKGPDRQPLDRDQSRVQTPILQELTFQPSPEHPRHRARSSGGGGHDAGKFRFRTSCSVLAASLKSRIPIRRVQEFLDPYEPPAAFYRRFQSRSATTETGKTVYPHPSTKPSLIFVQRGIIELFINCRKRRFAITRAVNGDVFGDAPLLGMSMFGSRARAVTDCRYVSVPAEVVEAAVFASHPLTIEWLRKVSSNLAGLQEENIELMFATVRQRLTGLLLKLADDAGVISGVNHMEIAGRLGVYRETVSSRLRDMKAEGIVSVSREMIKVLDREQMRRIASFREEGGYD
ncbi:MAG: Crp/Fnr family transcriptional regulator [Blastocatellia bacterium]